MGSTQKIEGVYGGVYENNQVKLISLLPSPSGVARGRAIGQLPNAENFDIHVCLKTQMMLMHQNVSCYDLK